MSNIDEAINKIDEMISHMIGPYGEEPECECLRRIKKLLESEPEPTVLYIDTAGMRVAAQSVKDGQGTPAGSMAKMVIDCCDYIDRLTAVNKKISAFADARLLEIDAKNLDIEKLQADLKAKDAEIAMLKPKPLLFGDLYSFKVITNEAVPDNQIWFATQAQIGEALEYSRIQIEKALKGKFDG